MNQLATTQKTPRSALRINAKLDLQTDGQTELRDFMQRMHTGRRPLLKCLGMRQVDGVLYEAVQWARMTPPSFDVVRWRPDGLGLSLAAAGSAREALAILRTTEGWRQVTDPQKTH